MIKERILVLGSTGQLGHQVVWRLMKRADIEISDLAYRTKLTKSTILHDVSDIEGLKSIILNTKPSIIVNCIGVLVKDSTNSPKRAILLNALMPHELAELCTEIGCKLVHISTDCVFSGNKGNYSVNDIRDGIDVYAKTKALGEIIDHPIHCTLRTSIVGPELKENGTGLFHWFMGEQQSVNGFSRAIWSGVTTYQLAKVIEEAIDLGINGLHQISNGTPINKYDLLQLFKSSTNKPIQVNSIEGKSVDKSLVPSKIDGLSEVPSYKSMVAEMVEALKENKAAYPDRYNSL